jgi:hypothetical protein
MSETKFCYTDSKGRIFNLQLDLLKVRQIDASDFTNLYPTKFTLGRFDKGLIGQLLINSPLLFAVLWVVVQEQVHAMFASGTFPVSPKEDQEAAEQEFVRGVNGAVVDAARTAFLESLADFFRDQQTALSALSRMLESARQKLVEREKEINPMVDQLMDQELDQRIEVLRKTLSGTPGTASTPSLP